MNDHVKMLPPGHSKRIRMLSEVAAEVTSCRACPRLVAWREQIAIQKRASFRDETYWARGVQGFGDPDAHLLVVGLAPAAHGANRTGRMFTGDRSGDWLFRAMHRAQYANQPHSLTRDDGLTLHDAWVTATVKCAPPANKPIAAERNTCQTFLERELAALQNVRVVMVLGSFAYQAVWRILGSGTRPKFGHGVEAPLPGGRTLLCSYHVSQQNTFTGVLTEEMLDAVFARARALAVA